MGCALLSGKAFDAGYIKTLLVGGTALYTARCDHVSHLLC